MKLMGKKISEKGYSLYKLGKSYYYKGKKKKEKAILLLQQALEIFEESDSNFDEEVIDIILHVAYHYVNSGEYTPALPLIKKMAHLVDQGKTGHTNEPIILLKTIGQFYFNMGQEEDAYHFLIKALEIEKKEKGEPHPDVTLSEMDIGELLTEMGDYFCAESFLLSALHDAQVFFGQKSKDVGRIKYFLGRVYRLIFRFDTALSYLLDAQEILEDLHVSENRLFLNSLRELAFLHQALGDFEKAVKTLNRVLEIEIEMGDRETIAQTIGQMADLYKEREKYEKAGELYKEALSHLVECTTISRCAVLTGQAEYYRKVGKYDDSLKSSFEALRIAKSIFCEGNHKITRLLLEIAANYFYLDKFQEAKEYCEQALAITLRLQQAGSVFDGLSLTSKNTNNGEYVNYKYDNIPELYMLALNCDKLDHKNDCHYYLVSSAVLERFSIRYAFQSYLENEKLEYFKENRYLFDELMSHTVSSMLDNENAVFETFNEWINYKGVIMNSQFNHIEVYETSDNKEITKYFEKLNRTRRQLAALRLNVPHNSELESYKIELEKLSREKENLELALNREQYAAFDDLAKEVKNGITHYFEKLILLIPDNSVYIDFVKIEYRDMNTDNFKGFRYLAFVLLPVKRYQRVELIHIGGADELEEDIRRFRGLVEYQGLEISSVEADFYKQSQLLYKKIMKPLEPFISGVNHIILSPDGELHLLPFEVLRSPQEEFLIEKFNISYMSSAKDFVKLKDLTVNIMNGEIHIFSNPDFNHNWGTPKVNNEDIGIRSYLRELPPLPGSLLEAKDIARIIANEMPNLAIKVYTGKNACEEELYKLSKPSVLHIATHGFFLSDDQVARLRRADVTCEKRVENGKFDLVSTLLRSGIALSGFNKSLRGRRGEGILTAEKILTLDLYGTEMVVLSACNTGVGDIVHGEGVFGLKRAFHFTGVKTLVMSLWNVPDKETGEIMTKFYSILAKGVHKAEALRQAKLMILKEKPNPFFWGGFVLDGDFGKSNLDVNFPKY